MIVILLEVNALAHLTISEGKLALIKQTTIHHSLLANWSLTSQTDRQTDSMRYLKLQYQPAGG